jgi:glycosyltransferase involved in cell wall biosynthesis
LTIITHSIIIPTKDRPNLLRRAVASAQAALGDGGEIIIVDDASVTPVDTVLQSSDTLRILRHSAPEGASSARNTGISHARGKVLFFLDDDDELMLDYVRTILSGPAQSFDYGFSRITTISEDGRKEGRRRFPTGPIPANARLDRRIFGSGMGFWIQRGIAESIGPFDTNLSIGEDTEFTCRLIGQGKRGWYNADVGVIVHRHNGTADQTNITRQIIHAHQADLFLLISTRFPAYRMYFGESYLRLCAMAKQDQPAIRFVRSQNRVGLRLWFWVFYGVKRLRHSLKRPKGA